MTEKIIIVGAGNSGSVCATRLRRLSEEIDIIIFDKSSDVSYTRADLPALISGLVKPSDCLTIATVEEMSKRYNVELRLSQEVIDINVEQKNLSIRDVKNNKLYNESFDKLVLAMGDAYERPLINGIDLPHVYSVNSLQDMQAILLDLSTNQIQHVTILGGENIGIRLTEAFLRKEKKVSLIIPSAQLDSYVDPDMDKYLQQELKNKQVDLKMNSNIAEIFVGEDEKNNLQLMLNNDKQTLATDMLLIIGNRVPETTLAKKANIVIGETGGIRITKLMQTSNSDIFAIGDATETINIIDQQLYLNPFTSLSVRKGRIAADNLLEIKSKYNGNQKAIINNFFNYSLASVGLNERQLISQGLEYTKIYVHAFDHPTYYPNASMISLKLLYSPEKGLIYGAQIYGQIGVAKRIDAIAVAQRFGVLAENLDDLELSFSPEDNSARNIIYTAGELANNLKASIIKMINAEDLAEEVSKDAIIVDVSTADEISAYGVFPNALSIPFDKLREKYPQLDQNKTIITVSYMGKNSYLAYRFLSQKGYKAVTLNGGFKTYQMHMAALQPSEQ